MTEMFLLLLRSTEGCHNIIAVFFRGLRPPSPPPPCSPPSSSSSPVSKSKRPSCFCPHLNPAVVVAGKPAERGGRQRHCFSHHSKFGASGLRLRLRALQAQKLRGEPARHLRAAPHTSLRLQGAHASPSRPRLRPPPRPRTAPATVRASCTHAPARAPTLPSPPPPPPPPDG